MVAPTYMKFQPTPLISRLVQKWPRLVPAAPAAAADSDSAAPARMTFSEPILADRRPVRNEGANMPSRCHWMTVAASPTV